MFWRVGAFSPVQFMSCEIDWGLAVWTPSLSTAASNCWCSSGLHTNRAFGGLTSSPPPKPSPATDVSDDIVDSAPNEPLRGTPPRPIPPSAPRPITPPPPPPIPPYPPAESERPKGSATAPRPLPRRRSSSSAAPELSEMPAPPPSPPRSICVICDEIVESDLLRFTRWRAGSSGSAPPTPDGPAP